MDLVDQEFCLRADIINGWKPRVDIKTPFPIYSEDRLSLMLSRRGDWIYKGFSPTNSYELHDSYASSKADSYECQDTNIRMYRELIGRGIIQPSKTIFPQSRDSPHGPKITLDSFFESGNLAFAFRPNPSQLMLFLNVDTNTRGHTQWFYFTAVAEGSVRISMEILNMSKPTSIFSRGGRPVWSLDNRNWHPVSQATYSETKGVDRTLWLPPEYRSVNSLKFPFEFEAKKKVYFAYGVPYTYSDLIKTLKVLHTKQNPPQQSVLCTTESGIPVPILAFRCTSEDPNPPAILVIARTHPGETCGSHMVNGAIQWLMSDNEASGKLRSIFDVHVLPMVNVDGVIAGNFRTGLAGDDLNRRFSKPAELLHPTVVALKNYVKNVNRTRGSVVCCLDLHGHSTKPDVFTYGPEMGESDKLYRVSRYYAKLLGDALKCFKPNRCSWRIPKSKSSTARAVMIRTFGVKLTYTVEASTSARTATQEDPLGLISGGLMPFSLDSYAQIGQNLMSVLSDLAPYIRDPENQEGLPRLPDPEEAEEDEDIEEGGSDSESGDEDYSQKEKKRFLMRFEASIKSNFDQSQSRAGKEYFARKTRKKTEAKSKEFTIQRMNSFSKSRPGLPSTSIPRKTVNSKDQTTNPTQAQLKLKSTLNSKPMMLNLGRNALKERDSFKNHVNTSGALSTKLEAVKQILQSKVGHPITRNHTMKDLSLQATPTKSNPANGASQYDRNQALTELARSFDHKRNAYSHVLPETDKARERAEARRRKIQGLQAQIGGMLYGIDQRSSHQTERHEPSELHDVLFSQVSIKFPRRGGVETEDNEFKPMISRKVLIGSDFSKLIQKNQKARGPSLPPMPAQAITRHRFLLRTKDG